MGLTENGVAPMDVDEIVTYEKRIVGGALKGLHLPSIMAVLGESPPFFDPSLLDIYQTCIRLSNGGKDLDEITLIAVARGVKPSTVEAYDQHTIFSLTDFADMECRSADYYSSTAKALQREWRLKATHNLFRQATDAIGSGADPEDVARKLAAAQESFEDYRAGNGGMIMAKTLKDLLETPPEATNSILGAGLFSEGQWMLIHAAPGVGKSWIVFELAVNLALGGDWYGINVDRRCKVGIMSLEETDFEFYTRFAPIFQANTEHLENTEERQEVAESILAISKDVIPYCDIRDESRRRQILELCIREGVRVLILDPLYQFFSGEETNQDFSTILSFIGDLWAKAGVSCVVVHHDRKGSTQGDQGTSLEKARGGGALTGSCRASFHLRRLDENEENSPVLLSCDKSNHSSARGLKIYLRHDDEQGGRLVLTTAPRQRGEANEREVFFQTPIGMEMTAKEISEDSGMGQKTVVKHLESLRKKGAVYRVQRPTENGRRPWAYGRVHGFSYGEEDAEEAL